MSTVQLTNEERSILQTTVRTPWARPRLVLRARIVLEAAAGRKVHQIARLLSVRPATVSKWCGRFVEGRIHALSDRERPGRPAACPPDTEARILATLDSPPPIGASCWNGRLVAAALGDVSKHLVWRYLRERGIYLERRPHLTAEAGSRLPPGSVSILGIFLDHSDNSLVVAVNRKHKVKAIEQPGRPLAQPHNGRKAQGAVALFAAIEMAIDLLATGRGELRTKREFPHFVERIAAEYPEQEIHVILDRKSAGRPDLGMLSKRWSNVYFDFTSRDTSWLNQVERWFHVLGQSDFPSPQQIRDAVSRLLSHQKPRTAPFKWAKQAVGSGGRRKSA